MKRYRFSFRVTLSSPAKFSSEFWNNQRGRFLNEFKPQASRYRHRQRIATLLLIGFLLAISSFTFFDNYIPDLVLMWMAALLLAGVVGACLILIFGLKLACPVCRKRLEPAKGRYCPQCGSDQFQYGRHLSGSSLYCPACDSQIDEGYGDLPRSYKIRGCTHCGVMLDEQGL